MYHPNPSRRELFDPLHHPDPSSEELSGGITKELRKLILGYATPQRVFISSTAKKIQYGSDELITPRDKRNFNLYHPDPKFFIDSYQHVDANVVVWYEIRMTYGKEELLKSGKIKGFTKFDTIQLDKESGVKLRESLIREDIKPLEKLYGGLYNLNDLEEAVDHTTFEKLFVKPTNLVTLFVGFCFDLDVINDHSKIATFENLSFSEDDKFNSVYHYNEDEKGKFIDEPLDLELMEKSLEFLPMCRIVSREDTQDIFVRVELELNPNQ